MASQSEPICDLGDFLIDVSAREGRDATSDNGTYTGADKGAHAGSNGRTDRGAPGRSGLRCRQADTRIDGTFRDTDRSCHRHGLAVVSFVFVSGIRRNYAAYGGEYSTAALHCA